LKRSEIALSALWLSVDREADSVNGFGRVREKIPNNLKNPYAGSVSGLILPNSFFLTPNNVFGEHHQYSGLGQPNFIHQPFSL
jgi:hypothetical protein